MAYTKQTWTDDDESTPLSAARLNHIEQGIFDAAAGLAGTVDDATTTVKGIVQLAGDLSGTASSPTVPTAVKTSAVDQTILGNKTFTNAVTVATPTSNGHAATKQYVDNLSSTVTVADATTSVKGKLQLAGDLAGTADLPTVPAMVKLTTDQTVSGNKTFANPLAVATPTGNTHATTKLYVDTADALKATLASPTFTGVPAAPTATAGTTTTQIATTAFVNTALTNQVLTLASVPAGYVHHVKCTGDIQPLRNTITTRTDIRIVWEKLTAPTIGGGYALSGQDMWKRASW